MENYLELLSSTNKLQILLHCTITNAAQYATNTTQRCSKSKPA